MLVTTLIDGKRVEPVRPGCLRPGVEVDRAPAPDDRGGVVIRRCRQAVAMARRRRPLPLPGEGPSGQGAGRIGTPLAATSVAVVGGADRVRTVLAGRLFVGPEQVTKRQVQRSGEHEETVE